jgi:signal transduction histidine kinase
MVAPPGDSYAREDTEALSIHRRLHPELVHHCPVFTAHTVHHMLDRARSFKTSDLQDEKLVSLGKLAAGLAHEINNPASATVRGAKQLRTLLAEADAASRALGAAGLTDEMLRAIEETRDSCLAHAEGAVRSPIEQADWEDTIADWLAQHQADPAHAGPLAETSATIAALDALARVAPAPMLDAALRWIATGCATQALAYDIEHAATRIHDLVAAVKRFTYMDAATGPESIDVSVGLHDTVRVLAAKARDRSASITLDIASDLPRVHAIGGELNQVWLNLLDNALDAVQPSGHVTLSAGAERDRVVVRVVDDGTGIPADILPRIFDPFFTTKPPGHGTGLGLEIAHQLVRQSNGDIAVQSRPGHTEFRVSFAAERPQP